uniref:Odorant receptors OR77 n=1 Tax=Lobesia botrana TaxID=209534 RepID=A0A345BEY9_9NEOP|nr:odorant receptors OR77 [Lobesia botrana]
MYLTCFFAILGLIRTLLPLFTKYGIIIERFLLCFHLIHFKHKGIYYKKIYEKVERFSYRLVTMTMSLTMLCAGVFNLVPVMNNIRSGAYADPNKTIEFSVFFSYPGFDPQNHHKFVTGWNLFLVFACAILVGGIDVVMTLFIFQIIGHIDILNNNLENFPKLKKNSKVGKTKQSLNLTADMFSNEENVIIKEKIKQCVEHHVLVISFTDDVSEFFGPVIAVYYLFHLVAGCMMLLELSAGDAGSLTRYGPLTVVIFGQLIIISVIFEIVNTKSEQLANTAYCLPWESMSVYNQRSLCLLLNRLQTPIVVTALGVTPVNVQTMFT